MFEPTTPAEGKLWPKALFLIGMMILALALAVFAWSYASTFIYEPAPQAPRMEAPAPVWHPPLKVCDPIFYSC